MSNLFHRRRSSLPLSVVGTCRKRCKCRKQIQLVQQKELSALLVANIHRTSGDTSQTFPLGSQTTCELHELKPIDARDPRPVTESGDKDPGFYWTLRPPSNPASVRIQARDPSRLVEISTPGAIIRRIFTKSTYTCPRQQCLSSYHQVRHSLTPPKDRVRDRLRIQSVPKRIASQGGRLMRLVNI